MMFTLFVIPGDNDLNPQRAIDSFGNLVTRSFILHSRLVPFHEVRTEYFGFLYADEFIEERLKIGLSSIFSQKNWHVLTLRKVVVDHGKMRWYQAPRIFRRGVILNEDFTPKGTHWYRVIEDGFIRENARV